MKATKVEERDVWLLAAIRRDGLLNDWQCVQSLGLGLCLNSLHFSPSLHIAICLLVSLERRFQVSQVLLAQWQAKRMG